MQIIRYDSPFGELHISIKNNAVLAIHNKPFPDDFFKKLDMYPPVIISGGPVDNVVKQLNVYFSGKRREFDLALELHGTDFQRKVWDACSQIPYGETRSYGEVATAIGKPKATRAVGSALGKNNIPIIIPCHRVLQSGGKLGGFGWGLDAKHGLLELEKKALSTER